LNGAGKSTLLRIMAGVDNGYNGETMLSKGFTTGLLEQEPQLDRSKTVQQVVAEAVQPITDLLARFDEVNNRFAEDLSAEEMERLLEEQARLQEELDRVGAWDLHSRLELAMDALPAGRHTYLSAVGRRAAPRGLVPPALDGTRHPPARRADEPPGCRVGRLAGETSAAV
jgi:ATPase subunit of ABC transporter with duplicated ATPase domains